MEIKQDRSLHIMSRQWPAQARNRCSIPSSGKRFSLLRNYQTPVHPASSRPTITGSLVSLSKVANTFALIYWGRVERRSLFGPLYQLRIMDNEDECGAASGMKNGQGKQKYSEKTCPCYFVLPKSHSVIWVRCREAAVRSRRLTAWAILRSA
jgi:hypothetical protein